jgi:hypothetical protein
VVLAEALDYACPCLRNDPNRSREYEQKEYDYNYGDYRFDHGSVLSRYSMTSAVAPLMSTT